MEADLIARLLADSGLSALVGNRVNYLSRVQAEDLPAITITQVVPGRAYTMAGPQGTHGTRVQFDIWAELEQATVALAILRALRAVLEAPAKVGATAFMMGFEQSRRDSVEDVAGHGEIIRISVDHTIWWQPA